MPVQDIDKMEANDHNCKPIIVCSERAGFTGEPVTLTLISRGRAILTFCGTTIVTVDGRTIDFQCPESYLSLRSTDC